jgi:murein DD-endopeptidase MepM/ murein hydrolase activator NlpD
MVVIDHGHGMVTRFGHIHKILVKRGDAVKRGDTIALMGNTGRSTGPHVHYEVHLNGLPVNPEKYILD